MNELHYFFYTIDTYPNFIKILFSSIFGTVFLTIILICYLFFLRYQNRKKEQLREKHKKFINQIIDSKKTYSQTKILSAFSGEMKITNEIRDLVIELLVLKINDNEKSNSINIKNLIDALQINDRIEKKLDFSRGITKLKTIEQISNLKLDHIDSKILPFAYSKNKFTRSIARYTYVQLSQNNPYKFFDEKIETFTKWDEINLLKSLKTDKGRDLPNFSTGISYSSNDLLKIFSIKMVAFFNQTESKSVVLKQLNHKNANIREAAILALGYLQASCCEQELIDLYSSQPNNCKIAILKTIGKFSSEKGLLFLENTYNQSINTAIRKIIAHEILNYGEKGKMLFDRLKHKEKDFNQLILLHVENPLIYYKYA